MRERYHRAAGAPSSKPLATHAYARSGTLMPSPGEPGREASIDPTTSHSHPHDGRGSPSGGTQIGCGYGARRLAAHGANGCSTEAPPTGQYERER